MPIKKKPIKEPIRIRNFRLPTDTLWEVIEPIKGNFFFYNNGVHDFIKTAFEYALQGQCDYVYELEDTEMVGLVKQVMYDYYLYQDTIIKKSIKGYIKKDLTSPSPIFAKVDEYRLKFMCDDVEKIVEEAINNFCPLHEISGDFSASEFRWVNDDLYCTIVLEQ